MHHQTGNDRATNGSNYYDYAQQQHRSGNERNASDYARNGEVVAGQMSSQQLTTGTSTPAMVAQALSGNNTQA